MPTKRASYAATFKKKVISVAESVGNREAARQFEISEANVRLWRKTKEQLLQQKPHSRASGRGKAAQFPEMEKELLEVIAEQRASGCAISTVELRLKALKIMQDKGNHEFKASANWCYLFMRRHNIPLKRRISFARLSTTFEDDLNTYQQVIFQLRKQHGYDIGCIANADQTLLTFALPCTIDMKDANTATIKYSGTEKKHLTVMLGAYGDGTKMIPYVIFKQKTLPNKCQWPNGVIVRCHPKGWMDEALIKDWIRSVWCKGKPRSRKMLVLDACRSNRMPAIKEILNENKTDLVLIPDGMTKQLQVMEVSCNRPFKHLMRQKWNEWITSETFAAGGKTRKPELVQITAWIKEAWDAVSPDIISRGFKNCCLTNIMEGTEDDIQWDDGAAVDEPMYEYETLDQVVNDDHSSDASDVHEYEAGNPFESFAAEDTDVTQLIGHNEQFSPQQRLAIKEEQEELPLHVKEEANNPQLPLVTVEAKSPQLSQLKEEEDEDPHPRYLKVEDKEPHFHVRQEEEAQHPLHVKEEDEDSQPPPVKQVKAAEEPTHVKKEEEEALSRLQGIFSVSECPLPGFPVNSGNHDDKPPEFSQLRHSSTPQHVTTAADIDHSGGAPSDTPLDYNVQLVPFDTSAENVTCSAPSCNERLKVMTAKIERLEQLLAKERREKKKLFKQKRRIELYVSKLFSKEPLDKLIRKVGKEMDC